MQLYLEAHRRGVGHHPVRQLRRVQRGHGRREENLGRTVIQPLAQHLQRPVVIGARGNDELHLLLGAQLAQSLPELTLGLAGSRRLDIHHAQHARVQVTEIDGPAGLDGDLVAGVAQRREQLLAFLLRQRLAAGNADMTNAGVGNVLQHVVHGHALTAVEGVLGIAVAATQRAAGQANETGGKAGVSAFPLQRAEDLRDAKKRLPTAGRCRAHSTERLGVRQATQRWDRRCSRCFARFAALESP